MRRAFLFTLAASVVLATAAHGQTFLNRPANDWLNDLGPKNPAEVRRVGGVRPRQDRRGRRSGPRPRRADEKPERGQRRHGARLRRLRRRRRDYRPRGQGRTYWARTGPALQQALKDKNRQRSPQRRLRPRRVRPRGRPRATISSRRWATRKPSSGRTRRGLGKLGQEAGPDGVAQLRGLLKDGDPLVRRDAMYALGEVGNPTAHPAVSAMMQAAGTESSGVVRKAAVEALSKLVGPDDKADAPLFIPCSGTRTRRRGTTPLSCWG